MTTLKIIAIATLSMCVQQVAMAAGWIRGLDVISLGENNVGGEVVQFTVREEIDSSVEFLPPESCRSSSAATVRDLPDAVVWRKSEIGAVGHFEYSTARNARLQAVTHGAR